MALNQQGESFQPCLLFFYGSLMDPGVLQTIAELNEAPDLQDASIEGFKMRMWAEFDRAGTYPTLLPQPPGENAGRIQGKAWKATSARQVRNLERYETSAYKITSCKIQLDNNEIVDGLTFCWSGLHDDDELEDGTFDLKIYQQTMKPFMFGF